MSFNNRPKVLEEIFNSLIHGIGIILSIIGLLVLFLDPVKTNSPIKIIGFGVFGTCLILMYLTSTLSHSLTFTKARKVFLTFDYSSIFLLIAGTYTPFMLLVLKGRLGWILLGIVWLLAILGITFKAVFLEKLKLLTLVFYLLLGWIAPIVVKPLWVSLKPDMFFLLVLGGICYSFGVLSFAYKKNPFIHAIWHLFVLFGSIFHFFAVRLI